jgi:V-type H+-transporting ATPase subunit C
LGLFNVVVLKVKAQDFKVECEKRKFKVREFQYDEERNKLSAIETQKLKEKKSDMRNELLGWCVNGFSESFINWIHLKCIKTFVESVLRYGVPPRFLCFLIKASGHERKIHRIFKDEFKELDDDVFDDVETASFGQGNDFYPYVLIPINTSDPLLHLN